ncbi:MAG: C4-dicarboxylate ABC transporter permease [bacterium]|nr:C4-dicarboxylate ABC transporter permease [bacterium]
MMAELFINLSSAFDPFTLWILFIGVVAGILIGSLPGLTATMGVTLLMPFTLGLGLTPQGSMAMLIGIYVGAIYGGSITAVLIATPGTPASAATLLDGYPMAQRGEGGRAIVLVTLGSFVGGLLGTLLLVFLSPQLSRFGLQFSSPEYFALAVFGLSMIVSISVGDVVKGLISGVFGLLIATAGLDPINGKPRFTFGMVDLYEGIGFIPVLIGLYAFAQVFYDMAEQAKKDVAVSKLDLRFPSIGEMMRYWGNFIGGGLLGTVIGALPGAGCDIAAFVGYNEAKRFSKDPGRFGSGAPEGVITPEAAKSGATGGAMIPMMTLGVPGDAVTAVMLNGLIVQGLQPGPLLFRDHLDVVYPIFAFMLFAYIVTCALGLISARWLARIVLLDKSLLAPVICVLSVVGAYAIRFSVFDVYTAIAFGGIGYFMRVYGFPSAPIVLALILGPMAESNLRGALMQPDSGVMMFVTRPITAVLLLFAIASLIWGLARGSRSTATLE